MVVNCKYYHKPDELCSHDLFFQQFLGKLKLLSALEEEHPEWLVEGYNLAWYSNI